MHGNPQEQGRDPGSEQDRGWPVVRQTVRDDNSGLTNFLPEGLELQVRQENRQAQDISLRIVDNAILFLKHIRFQRPELL